ncbi:MAG: hypothetical protein P8127_02925 [Acidobacteriota bacterium]
MTPIKIPVMAVAVVMLAASCNSPMTDIELMADIEEFETAIEGQPRDTVQTLLRAHAHRFLGQEISVTSAVVASTYTRENTSNIYFGVNYDPNDHIFLSELDPSLHESLENHQYWVSVVRTYPSRQMSFELPVTELTFKQLEQGMNISFSCRIAALIRGRSVYCTPTEITLNP